MTIDRMVQDADLDPETAKQLSSVYDDVINDLIVPQRTEPTPERVTRANSLLNGAGNLAYGAGNPVDGCEQDCVVSQPVAISKPPSARDAP